MEFKLQALSIYEYGQRKDKEGNPHQEDWIYPSLGTINNEKDRLFVLCDGMGGHAAGEVASATVCEAMSKTINEALEKGEKFSENLLSDAIDAAYNLLDERDTSEDGQKKMGTTMTFLMLHEEGATIAHIGDSRVYHIRPKTGKKEDLVFCTRDHSLVNDLIKIGEITEEQALNHPQKNVITRAMQPNQEHRHKADIITKKNIRPGDYFYMCSDGMLEQTSDDNLCFMLANDVTDEEKRDMLIRVSKNNHDNHSAHLIHILDVKPESEIEDDSIPLSLPSLKETEDDEDIVNPEFEESETSEEMKSVEEDTNIPPSETEEDESEKMSATVSSESTAVEGGTETSAVFLSKKETTDKDGGRNKLMWGIIACVAIAILAICGVLFSKFPKKEEVEVAQPPVQKTGIQKSQINKSREAVPEKISTESDAPSKNTTEQGTPPPASSNEHHTSAPNTSSDQSSTTKPSKTEESASTTANVEQAAGSQAGQSNNPSRVNQAEAAIQKATDDNTGNVVQSEETKVKQAIRK